MSPSDVLTESPQRWGPLIKTPSITAWPPTGISRFSQAARLHRARKLQTALKRRFIRQKILDRNTGMAARIRLSTFPFHQTIRSGDIEKKRCRPAGDQQHSSGEFADFPLGSPAQPEAEEVMEFPGIHGQDKTCPPPMGQQVSRIFPRDAFFDEFSRP